MRVRYLLICGLFSFSSKAQYLDVPLIAQEQPSWCWAANINMIDAFHSNTLSTTNQCDIACIYHYFRDIDNNLSPLAPYTGCCNTCSNTKRCSNVLMFFSKRHKKLHIDFFSLVSSYFGYNTISDVEISQINWNHAVNEIQRCRPFVLFLNQTGTNGNHIVLSKGYYTDPIDATQYLIVNDPKAPEELAIPFDALSKPTTHYNSAFLISKGIFPKNTPECLECERILPIEENPLVSKILQSTKDKQYFGLGKTSWDSLEFNFLLKTANGLEKLYDDYVVSYQTIDGKEVKKCIALVTNKANPKIITIFEKVNSKYLIKQIGLDNPTSTPFVASINIKNQFNNKSYTVTKNNFEIVEFFPNSRQFYKFSIDNKTLFSPVVDYPELEFKKGVSYKEDAVINKLSAEVKGISPDLAVPPKRCFLLRWLDKKSKQE